MAPHRTIRPASEQTRTQWESTVTAEPDLMSASFGRRSMAGTSDSPRDTCPLHCRHPRDREAWRQMAELTGTSMTADIFVEGRYL